MTFVRNLVADLVAKRLWPVAVVLVVGLVAVPVALKGNAAEAPALPVAGAQAPAASTPAVSIAQEGRRGGISRIGRNPFAQKQVAPPASTVAAAAGVATVASTVGTFGGGLGDGAPADLPAGSLPGMGDVQPIGGTPMPSTPAAPATPRATADRHESYSVDIRFGTAGALRPRNDVPRLAPLPSAQDPFFVFLGVLADGKTAMFLVSSDAEATGDGKCLPSVANCERVEMQAGQTEFFDVTRPDGSTVQYQLDLVRVARERQANAAVAAAARTRESAPGRQILRSAVDTGQVEISDLAFSPRMGLLVPSGKDQDQAGSIFGGYRVNLRFGAPNELVKRYDLARLTPLPSVDSPSFIFMGVLGDGETALFLNPSQAAASGDAVCSPTPEQCDRVAMKAGGEATFDVATLDGQTTQYGLALDGIDPILVDTPAEALASRTRESKAGREVLRRLITEVGSLVSDLSFSSQDAAIVPVTK